MTPPETEPVVDIPTAVLLGSFAFDAENHLHGLVRSARAGSPDATSEIVDGVRRAMASLWREHTDATVVPVPPHLPGPPNRLVMAVCGAIAEARDWQVAHDALRRTRVAPEGKAGGPRDPRLEAASLSWRVELPGRVIVLVDDVVRTGATFAACSAAVRATGDARPVVALAVARAVGDAPG